MITILCNGSTGDIQPYIALAQEIKKQGKEVKIITGKSFKDYIESYGIHFSALSADYKSVDIDPKFLEEARSSDNPLKMLLTFNKMKKFGISVTEEMYALCDGSDVIVYHPGCIIGYFAAKDLGIPAILASPFPMHKTKEVSSIIAYGRFNFPYKFTYKLLQSMLWMASKTNVISFYKNRFKKLPKDFECPFEKIDEKHRAIISCSNYVFSRPSDWDKNIYQNGYWFVEEIEEFEPDRVLNEFLISGEKPIYFGFGSVFNALEKEKLTSIIIDALKETGKRGIISGMGEIEDLPKNIISVGSCPHTWLFNKVAAVCHHGGAGTTAAGFRAGIPSMIVPFSNDQFAWAHRVFDLGVGARPIPKKKLTTKALIEAIQFTEQDYVINNAKELGRNIAKENGLSECAKIIISLDRGHAIC